MTRKSILALALCLAVSQALPTPPQSKRDGDGSDIIPIYTFHFAEDDPAASAPAKRSEASSDGSNIVVPIYSFPFSAEENGSA
jgi:hypothetical protein